MPSINSQAVQIITYIKVNSPSIVINFSQGTVQGTPVYLANIFLIFQSLMWIINTRKERIVATPKSTYKLG